ncbi:MAG: indole-3-glycerol phosphate synthase TrpC [Bacteroidota bacterium]
MNTLDRILDDTRALVARRKTEASVADLEARPAFSAPTRPFAGALRRDDLAVIAEIKKASPSQGVIRPDFDPVEIAGQYERGGAAALSVLTEPLYFQGSLDILAAVRAATDLPILRKDFVVDEYQLVEARAYGADAVLLIAAALDPAALHDLHDAATDLGLACLVELHAEAELEALDLARVQVLGVNNRDLRTFEVDIERAPRVLAGVPERIARVAESGLKTAADLALLRRRGIDAVLIGETFMRAPDPGAALAGLRRDTARLLATQSV